MCLLVAVLQIGERTAAQMEQCKAWWDEQTAAKMQQKQLEQEEKCELAATIRWEAWVFAESSVAASNTILCLRSRMLPTCMECVFRRFSREARIMAAKVW
jgi:hypothetical protein